MRSFMLFYSSQNTAVIKSSRMRWARHVGRLRGRRKMNFGEKCGAKSPLGKYTQIRGLY
jgi:hypothetical protein